MLGTAQETQHQNRGVLRSVGSERFPAPAGGGLLAGDMGVSAHHCDRRHHRYHWLARVPLLPRFGKMVVATVKRSGLMTKHQIENLCWREVSWQRPFDLEDVWEALTHLSALSPRGAVLWECRGRDGHVTHLLGADRMYIGKIKQALQAHGDIRGEPDTRPGGARTQNHQAGAVAQHQFCPGSDPGGTGGDDGGQTWHRDSTLGGAGEGLLSLPSPRRPL